VSQEDRPRPFLSYRLADRLGGSASDFESRSAGHIGLWAVGTNFVAVVVRSSQWRVVGQA
jgi:hypothetical protein